jgi:hypothetical protein
MYTESTSEAAEPPDEVLMCLLNVDFLLFELVVWPDREERFLYTFGRKGGGERERSRAERHVAIASGLCASSGVKILFEVHTRLPRS